jgi:excinuclease ABC subunit C
MKFKFLNRDQINKLPEIPGVYAFKNKGLLYIGKAVNIRERVKNHFNQPTFRDNLFIEQVEKIGYVKTGSEIEALILEAELIKKYQPRFNIVWRDDKNYFFAAMTKEKYPRILITHQPKKNMELAGPFVDGKALKETLKFLRKVFPYRSCNFLPKKSCLWYYLDRCPAPCLLKSGITKEVPVIEEKIKKNIGKDANSLFDILGGKKTKVLTAMKKEMKDASKLRDFEKAAKIRNKIFSLEKVLQNAKVFNGQAETAKTEYAKTGRILGGLSGTQRQVSRIEAYDISNMQGKEAVGSSVVFINGLPDKSFYRKFRIKASGKPDDIGMIKEMLSRRFSHKEWGLPDLILIDGGKAQLNAAIKIKKQEPETENIPAMALAKKHNELFIEGKRKPILLARLPKEVSDIILQLRDEAHRFAISYHKKLRSKSLFGVDASA